MPEAAALALLDNPAFAKLRKVTFYNINPRSPRLSKGVERRLSDRFGAGLRLDYSALCTQT